MEDTTYNGWKNYETWNVVLWLDNDEGFYSLVKDFGDRTYEDFVYDCLLTHTSETPDGVKWLDRKLDWEALDKYLEENCDASNEE